MEVRKHSLTGKELNSFYDTEPRDSNCNLLLKYDQANIVSGII